MSSMSHSRTLSQPRVMFALTEAPVRIANSTANQVALIRRRHSLAPGGNISPNNRMRIHAPGGLPIASVGGSGAVIGSTHYLHGSPHLLAIDSKIEQAMDLVKTHLMYAVREEVEALRAKIVELESSVIQLEAENSILREHVPADVLPSFNSSAQKLARGSVPRFDVGGASAAAQ